MMQEENITITIDGKHITIPKGTTVYKAIEQLGINVPIFCYQDRMPPFGACRVCLVEVEKMPKLQASCTLEATEGMVIHTQSEKALKGRSDIIEYLLINHPLDCPICDKGGECPLQENAYNHGPGLSRFFEDKRKFNKPLPLGPVLMLDRERCIMCGRCTRFGDLLAGDHALEVIDRGYRSEIGTPNGLPVKSKFIGNTISICPVGALTSQVYRFRARPWDNDSIESSCTLCPVGCSFILDSRDGEIMRTRALENRRVNDIWLCDKGWFGYEFVYHPERLTEPLIYGKKATWEEAFDFIEKKLRILNADRMALFGGNPLTLEENYLFQSLGRNVLKTAHLDHRIGLTHLTPEEEVISPGMEIKISDCENLETIIFLGTDITEEFPVLWLRLRQAINKGAKVIYAGNYLPEIERYFTEIYLHKPGEELAILQKINFITNAAIFIGNQYLSSLYRSEILEHLQRIKKEKQCTLNLLEGSGNSLGARWAGMHPHFEPEGKHARKAGLNAFQVLEEAAKNSWDFIYCAGANPAGKVSNDYWKKVRANTHFIVVQDLFLTETAKEADVVLPTLSFIEKRGRMINIEGSFQYLQPGKEIPENLLSDGEIFTKIAKHLGHIIEPKNLKPYEITAVTGNKKEKTIHKGQFYAVFTHHLFDHGIRMKHNPRLLEQTKTPPILMNQKDGLQMNLKNEDIIQVTFNGKSMVSKVLLSHKVSESVLLLPLGFEEIPLNELQNNLRNGLTIEVSKI